VRQAHRPRFLIEKLGESVVEDKLDFDRVIAREGRGHTVLFRSAGTTGVGTRREGKWKWGCNAYPLPKELAPIPGRPKLTFEGDLDKYPLAEAGKFGDAMLWTRVFPL